MLVLSISNACLFFISCGAVYLGYVLGVSYDFGVGWWLFGGGLFDLALCLLCEGSLFQLRRDLVAFTSHMVAGQEKLFTLRETPADTAGLSMLEGWWWLAFLQLIDHAAFAAFVYSFPKAAGQQVKLIENNDSAEFARRYGDEQSAEQLAQTLNYYMYFAAIGAAGASALLTTNMALAGRAITWFQVIQGCVEHATAVAMVCACAVAVLAVRLLNYADSLPDQVFFSLPFFFAIQIPFFFFFAV